MHWLKRYFTITPLDRPGDSAAAYVPLVMISRGLSFLRTLVVARILGANGQYAFGLYQPALEFINPLVALILFGAADVAERYISRVEHEHGHRAARLWAAKQAARIVAIGLAASAILIIFAPVIGRVIWGQPQTLLLTMCALTMIALALYQHLSSTLRGIRAFHAAAGMELLGAVLLLILSALAAPRRDATPLLGAYAASVLIPFAIFAILFWHYTPASPPKADRPTAAPLLATAEPEKSSPVLSYTNTPPVLGLTRFAFWSLIRLLLVMLFGFLSIWGVRYLSDSGIHYLISDLRNPGLYTTAQFSIPFRIAQLLGFLAVTLWASTYGIAARAWSHGRVHRARIHYFRVGRLGLAALMLVAVALLLSRSLIAKALPAYDATINELLPAMMAIFIGYALVSFFSSYADLREQPQRGAALWATAVVIQAAAIALAHFEFIWDWEWIGPERFMIWSSAIGLSAALLLVGPLLLWKPFHLSGIGLPLIAMALAATTLLLPLPLVNYIAPPIILGTTLILLITGQLLRPIDRRALRRRLAKLGRG